MSIGNLIKDENSLIHVDDILGYHGTSIEAVKFLAQEGTLPDSGLRQGKFSIIPLDYGVTDALWYANQIGVRHYLEEMLPFEIPSHMHLVAAQSLVDEKLQAFRFGTYRQIFQEFMSLSSDAGILESDVINLVKEGYDSRKGCLLTLSTTMLDDFKVNNKGEELEFLIPSGVNKKYISAIHPSGEYEKQVLCNILEQAA